MVNAQREEGFSWHAGDAHEPMRSDSVSMDQDKFCARRL